MLRLVHPPPGGNGIAPPTRRKGARAPAFFLTPDETRHFRAALTNASMAHGGMDVLAAAMGVPVKLLYKVKARRLPSGILAIRLAAAAGIAVEAVLGAKLADAGKCPTCGARVAGGCA